jgi:hypothetical protein
VQLHVLKIGVNRCNASCDDITVDRIVVLDLRGDP